MEDNKQKRINEINEKIENLREHAMMWEKSSSRGGKLMMTVHTEIQELELEKEDLINGTNKLRIYKIEKEIRYLNAIKSNINIFKNLMCNREIKKLENELRSLKK